jgi:transcription antitermination factor NusG
MEKWFVLNTKPKKEHQVERLFIEGGIQIYFPKYILEAKVKPFFPGYGFIYFDFPAQYQLVRYTRGVKRIVGNEAGPIPIETEVIDQIKTREVKGYIELNKFGRYPGIGDEIEVMEGPLKGLRGIFQRELTDRERVLILLNYVSYQGQLIIEKRKLKKVLK